MRPLGGKPRGAAEALIIPAGALAVSLILFGIFVAFAGANPLAVYRTIYRGAFGSWFSWQNTLQRAAPLMLTDRKSTRLNSSHITISYAVFCLKKKNITKITVTTVTDTPQSLPDAV